MLELLRRLLSNTRVGERFCEATCQSFIVTLLRQNLNCTATAADDELSACFLNQREWILRTLSFDAENLRYLGLFAQAPPDPASAGDNRDSEFAI